MPFTELELAGSTKLAELVQRIGRVAETLDKLHAERKFHRDIKPANLFDLGGETVIGDFGLVDFPDKEAITASAELVGPFFFIAPEMMYGAADQPGGPADVYSLSKTLWALAAGLPFPIPGELRIDSPQLCLRTWCPHDRADQLGALIERCTSTSPADRPSMRDVARELTAWITRPEATVSPPNVADLATKYSHVFDLQKRAERRREQFVGNLDALLESTFMQLSEVARMMEEVTQIQRSTVHKCKLLPRLQHMEGFSKPRALAREARCVETETGDLHHVRIQSFVQMEALDDETIRVVGGHLVHYEAGESRKSIQIREFGVMVATQKWRSAALESGTREICNLLLSSAPKAIDAFAEQVKAVQR